MSTDDTADDADEADHTDEEGFEDPVDVDSPADAGEDGPSPRERLEEGADRAVEGFDEGIVDLLAWVLDTETRARIYVYLRQQPWSTSQEIADGTGLYPSTVREALAELHEEDRVQRRKRKNEGAGNNPYEYTAIAPSELVGDIVGDVQQELNTVFRLDEHLGSGGEDLDDDADPVRITVREEDDDGTDPA